ncbi:MAG TPA: ParB/RepB/Spo0J family partition protein, partial [Archangium sp.]|nr:ParB/RepB/Spo0J family partition protein [Archangium sp.]
AVIGLADKGPLPAFVQVEPSGIMWVPIDKIERSPDQPRAPIKDDDPKLLELVNQLRERGELLQPVGLRRDANGAERFILRWGERRWRAHGVLAKEDPKWLSIKATMLEGHEDEVTRAFDAITENTIRHNLNALEEGNGYKRLRDEFKVPVAEIARRSGKSEKHVQRCLQVADAPEALRKAFTVGLRVPQLDDEGTPVYQKNPDGSTKTELVKEGDTEKAVPKPSYFTATIEDLGVGLELVKLYNHLVDKNPKKADKVFLKHLERILGTRPTLRTVAKHVDRVMGRGKDQTPKKQDKAAPVKARSGGAPRIPSGAAFHHDERQLYVDFSRLGELDGPAKASLLGHLNAAVRRLS